MTVRELIDRLSQEDGDREVWIVGPHDDDAPAAAWGTEVEDDEDVRREKGRVFVYG